MLVPKVRNTTVSPGEQRSDALVAFLVLSEERPVPVTIPVGTPFETPPIYTQGFNQFQGLIQAAPGATLRVEYGICHPISQAVVGYRTLVASVATSGTMLSTWGARGQTAVALQGDLWTLFTLRLTALATTVTVNELVLWFGIR